VGLFGFHVHQHAVTSCKVPFRFPVYTDSVQSVRVVGVRLAVSSLFLSRDRTNGVWQAAILPPGRNLQITVGRMALNMLAYF